MSEISDILNALKFGQVHQLDIELTPEQSADLLTHIDDLHFAVNEQPELTARIAELEAENERFTVHSDIERQDDKSPNHTQIDTVVY
jgi:hypothetical protein